MTYLLYTGIAILQWLFVSLLSQVPVVCGISAI
jgi:hypothetical protein